MSTQIIWESSGGRILLGENLGRLVREQCSKAIGDGRKKHVKDAKKMLQKLGQSLDTIYELYGDESPCLEINKI